MANFAENLAGLPSAEHLAYIEITDSSGHVSKIENKPGSQGSLKVYAYLAGKYSSLTPEAADEGLSLFAEHTQDAMANPGKHPNIDRLLAIKASQNALRLHLHPA